MEHRVEIKKEVDSGPADFVVLVTDPYEPNNSDILAAVLGQLEAGATSGSVTVPVTVAFKIE